MTKRRVGREQSERRDQILDAAQLLMVDQGYAALSVRKIATQANVTPALVQYYFPAMDALLLAVYRRAADQSLARQAEALGSDRPLHALWRINTAPEQTALAIEFMALANHKPGIRDEIAAYNERSRALQAGHLARLLATGNSSSLADSAAGVSLLLAGAGRALVMEQGLGITGGHKQARRLMTELLARLEPSPATDD